MAILNPDHLLDQADQLVASPAARLPRQADLRRAISTAYYAVFHFVLTQAADEFVGITQRHTARYALVYRSVDHRQLKTLCQDIGKQPLPAKFAPYAPRFGFGPNIPVFAKALVDLQERRHLADYDPTHSVKMSDARKVVGTARSAIRRFQRANVTRRKAFLTLLLFPPR